MELSRDKIKEIINDDWLLMDDCEGNKNCDVVKELARIALASLEAERAVNAEPVAWVRYCSDGTIDGPLMNYQIEDCRKLTWTPLYAVKPAKASIHDVLTDMDALEGCREWLLSQEQTVNVGPVDGAHDVLIESAAGYLVRVVDACRAAMFQSFGNSEQLEPVTTVYKLRDAVETIRNSGIAIDAKKIFAERDALNAPDCWCRTCRPITLTDMRFVVCPDCGNKRCPHANDHRNACSGSNEQGQEGSAYPAAPQQEVN